MIFHGELLVITRWKDPLRSWLPDPSWDSTVRYSAWHIRHGWIKLLPQKGEIGEIVILCHLSIKHIKQICVRIKNPGEINIVLPSPVQIEHPHYMVPDGRGFVMFSSPTSTIASGGSWILAGWGCWGGYNHIKAPFIEKSQASHDRTRGSPHDYPYSDGNAKKIKKHGHWKSWKNPKLNGDILSSSIVPRDIF